MTKLIDTLLLCALPASGKSEVRRYLAELDPNECRRDFHMGETVQLDDFPYVHLMRRVDETLRMRGEDGVYFQAGDRPFRDPWDWGTLIQLINEDYERLVKKTPLTWQHAGRTMLERFDACAEKAGARIKAAGLRSEEHEAVAEAIEREAREWFEELNAGIPESLEGKTVVIEFARGGKDGSDMPLKAPFGDRHSFAQLSPQILSRSSVLYVWVTPEESRRKNEARTDPNDPGSILHHGVPIAVMLGDYGCDDMDWLLANSGKADHVKVEAEGQTFLLPLARFDNRVDKTSFIRAPKAEWDPADVAAVHQGLKDGLDKLV